MRTLYALTMAALLVGCGDGDGTKTPTDTGADATIADDTAQASDTVAVGGDAADASEDAGVDDADTTPIECPAPTGARPAARGEHAGVYDEAGGQLVIFGGSRGVPVNCSTSVAHTFDDATWIYDVACDQWREVADKGIQGRVRHSAVYDARERRMIVYGGRWRPGTSGNYTLQPEVMALDLETETWTELPTTNDPPARFNHAAVYEPEGHRMLVFGGNTSGSATVYADTNDVWSLDLATNAWTRVETEGGRPAARFWAAGAWDATRRWFVIFGGSNAQAVFSPTATYYEDAWALDFTATPPTWYRLDVGGGATPDDRFWGGLVHDTVNDAYLAFAGHDSGNLANRNDMWSLAPLDGVWTSVNIGDTYNAPPTGFCSFPPDFAIIDPTVPERRHAMVFAPAPGGVWLSGGKTDCGLVDDVFFYDFATGLWEEHVPATLGEACLRQGGVGCTDMCF